VPTQPNMTWVFDVDRVGVKVQLCSPTSSVSVAVTVVPLSKIVSV
jgi:hypothetical protein